MGNKGTRTERELVNKLWEKGYAVMRSPTSGGGRKHPQPDVLFSNGEITVAVEAKSSSKRRVYIDKNEIKQLSEFCEKFGALGLIGLRFDYDKWRFLDPSYLEDVGKNYKVIKRTARKHGKTIDEI